MCNYSGEAGCLHQHGACFETPFWGLLSMRGLVDCGRMNLHHIPVVASVKLVFDIS
jgi:hypothetical protein